MARRVQLRCPLLFSVSNPCVSCCVLCRIDGLVSQSGRIQCLCFRLTSLSLFFLTILLCFSSYYAKSIDPRSLAISGLQWFRSAMHPLSLAFFVL
ncbi:unnamed protein product [Coffea canephora]|uniref:Uncharacterized protein n=1 Tax=Coffea canephora TaxID=49390 RepID=A0A068UDR1_COFCA|nr:unnamed protein product [Coffea canephora]